MGAGYHSVTVYAHEDELVGSLFDNGFGKRCIDAICSCAGGRKAENVRELERGRALQDKKPQAETRGSSHKESLLYG